ncbi:hypothetical protein LVJ94_20385 [Pendulispora rubella]|uniref:Lipoprotein n=1 Tax=Pendulispora rubella TaxID=2741070 RepID=A0ABZ2LF72_9BACT
MRYVVAFLSVGWALVSIAGCSNTLRQGERCGDWGHSACDEGLFCDDKSNWTCQPPPKYTCPPYCSSPSYDAGNTGDAGDAADSGDAADGE